jgi:hypothetical protein
MGTSRQLRCDLIFGSPGERFASAASGCIPWLQTDTCGSVSGSENCSMMDLFIAAGSGEHFGR